MEGIGLQVQTARCESRRQIPLQVVGAVVSQFDFLVARHGFEWRVCVARSQTSNSAVEVDLVRA